MKDGKEFTSLISILETYDPENHIVSIKPESGRWSYESTKVEVVVHRIKKRKILGWELMKKVLIASYVFDKNNPLLNIINPTFEDDRKVDVLAFMRYAEKGFNENPVDIMEALSGAELSPETRKHLEEFNFRLNLLHCAVGMADEAGEILDHIKKYVFHNKPFDKADIASEFGDFEWYKFNALRLLGITQSDTFKALIIKLDARYPNGRDKNYLTQANAKDTVGENNLIRDTLYSKTDDKN